MLSITLFLEFFKIGLFAVGGGLVTIPFLYELSNKTNWFSQSIIPDMIAISESTPGPLGVNMATYTGFVTNNFLGGIIATLGLVTPSIIIILIISKFLEKFRENKTVKKIFYGLRAAVVGLILIIGFEILTNVLFISNSYIPKIKELILFLGIFILLQKTKLHPVVFTFISGLVGILFKF